MLRWLFDLLFVRAKWTVIEKIPTRDETGALRWYVYVMQDQYGNIKNKRIW